MVKADVRRDYYADLGLTPSAESEDIKKQFRKLALKYHPDRNPGRELEFISKFQAIQAAHEILSDAQQRLRYDTDRLRAGYGKLYGPPKPSATRKTATSNFASTPSPKPPTAKQPSSARPQSYHSGPSSGAQRYASYARAAPKQPWEKTSNEGQTRADAYRGFQEMKGNGMPGWNQFDPRTGRSAFPGATPRPTTASAGQQRPKSAYEYFKTSPKPSTPDPSRAQSARKKQGFAPRAAAGGDEPMASSTSSYSNAYRGERSQTPNVFGTAPSPTARKAAAGFSSRADTLRTPEFERASRQYASTGGERTFFSSTGFGRSSSVRDSTGSPKPYSRTNPPSPTPPESGRHRSASPKFKTDTSRNYSSTSSSETDDDDIFPAHKPKAVPKSRLRPHQKFSGFHTQQPGGATNVHEFDGTASPRNVFGARAQTPFESTQGPKPNNVPHTGNFKSSSHDDLRKPFSADSWGGLNFFKPAPPGQEPAQSPTRPGSRGRTETRNSPKPGSASADASSTHDSSRSGSTSQQKYPPFPEGKFHADDWTRKFSDSGWAMPKDDESKNHPQQATNTQRQRSPRKQNTRPGAKVRPTPQPATVATEAEEAESTVNGSDKPEPPKTGSDDAEAMDLDDELPANMATGADTTTNVEGPAKDTGKETPSQTQPASSSTETSKESKLFNLDGLREAAPFTSTSNGGIDDLQDIHASLPFESRAKASRTTMNDIRAPKLVLPNPPKRPQPPSMVPMGLGSERLGLSRAAWDRHLAEMEFYMRRWSSFNKEMLHHFVARQETLDTGMAPHWLGAVGDSTGVKVSNGDDQNDSKEAQEEDDDETKVPQSSKCGFNAYVRALEQDRQAQKHWEVAREMHMECIIAHGQLRDALLNGSRLF
ncbi:hypothetical protein N8T08_002288 [Aspergillus melleus]|uniref:Uncharacterized protein n=1 Tax=Aspergillus melleus TaxID=138277 RepID=A0ACC3B8M8_9EURO|nr:hypothetical protein N8T08_002288 [Aspergillus melleus]